MPNREIVLLKDHTSRSLGRKKSLFSTIGLPFIVVGFAAPVILFFKWNPEGDGWSHVLGVAGTLVFFAAAVLLIVLRVRMWNREDNCATYLSEHPDTPWCVDYNWDATGSTDRVGERLVESDIRIMMPEIFRWLTRGRSILRFSSFPFFLGQKLDAHLPATGALAGFRSMEITLRCIRERLVEGSRGKYPRCYQVYTDSRIIDGASLGALDTEIPVVFHLPAEGPGTTLSAEAATYWEIEVKADGPGTKYGARFLVPVYAKPIPPLEAP